MESRKLKNALPPAGAVYAIGNFDGVHPGHCRLFHICKDIAHKNGSAVCALTFTGLAKDGGRLISVTDRDTYLRDAGADYIIAEDFSAIRNMSALEFISDHLVKRLSPSAIVCGENFRFGKGAEGDASMLGEVLAKHGISLHIADTEIMDGEPVSTSRVKSALSEGNVEYAEKLLGRRYSIAYPVEEGKKLGRTIGAPTINQRFPEGMFIPRYGVYAGEVNIEGKTYPCVTNVGVRPTVDDGDFVTAESYIVGYEGDLYGDVIRVEFVRYLRGEIKFDSVEALGEQIARDAAEAVNLSIK